MHRATIQTVFTAGGFVARTSVRLPVMYGLKSVLLFLFTAPPGVVLADADVEFDFARTAECRDVTPAERVAHYPAQRLVELSLPVSVRFHGAKPDDVEELTFEITGPASGMRVFDFAPATQLASDIEHAIETTKTTKSASSLDGSLGGALPIPYAAEVAHVTPTINAGISSGEATTEKINRVPPKYAVVVSGTAAEGRGVFFKLKRWSQTSLEGVHPLSVTFIVPTGWRGGEVYVNCSAGGQRKVLFIKQSATLGNEAAPVRMYLAGNGSVRQVAKPVLAETAPTWRPNRGASATASEVAEMVKAVRPERVKRVNSDSRKSLMD